MRYLRIIVAALALAGAPFAPASAAVPLAADPSWESEDEDYATGGMLWDLDGDGFLDLVVGNGNDMDAEYDAVFYNRRGELERDASWRSADIGYDGHIDMGDVDADGDLDVVITGFLDPEREQLYRNDDGALTSLPVWMNEDFDNSFACALGDVDGDGDLDLATVSGYFDAAPVLVYTNEGGAWETRASWRTPVEYDFNDVGWCDVDGDGDLDLAAAGHDIPCYLFENVGGTLDTRPSWATSAEAEFNQLTFGDVDGDGWRDMVVSDNSNGFVALYRNVAGTLESEYSWSSAPIRYASCVKLADVDADGDLDLAAGGWWSPIQVYENAAGDFGVSPAWSYYPTAGALVCEQAVWGDVDNDGLRFVAAERYDGDGARKLWYLSHAPLHAFMYARVEGRTLGPDDYCFHPEDGWVALARAPRAGAAVEFGYVYSTDLELAVTNWDEPQGNYLFDNTRGREVRISSFAVLPADGGLVVRWAVTAGGAKAAGFNAYRRRVDVGPAPVPIVRVNGDLITAGGASFTFADTSVAGGGTYDYWLEAVLHGGGLETFGPRRGYARKVAFALGQSYPNPARGAATIPFSLEVGADVTLRLYDLAGRRVATLYDGFAQAGNHTVRADVSALAPGVYVYFLTAAEGEAAGKMVVAR